MHRSFLVLILFLALAASVTRGLGKGKAIEADLCVVEATPGGVACAIRAAREGLKVVLVNRTDHPGGILSSGLGVWDTVWEGKRSPIYDELRQSVFDYYRDTYGEESSQYRHSLPGKSGHTNGKFEPRVIEQLISGMIGTEENITFLPGYVPVSVESEGRIVHSVVFREFEGAGEVTVKAIAFADCTYEGDLLPLAGVSYRVGREPREEFGEPHAGKVYMRSTEERPAPIADDQWEAHQALQLRHFSGFQEIVLPQSTGKGDANVQAFNYRTILTDDPENRIDAEKPGDFDPEFLRQLEYGSIVHPIPNRKIGWNRPQLVGLHQQYVEGDWETRQRVMDAHWDATMGLLWFLQHDPSVPAEKREYWKRFGLAKDEFPDNGHRPYEIYVREARRLEGRLMLTQHDLMPFLSSLRPPAYADAIAMSDWYMDSHAVTKGCVEASLDEGKMMLHAETWPGHIPWRCLLPKELDNLVVPVCFSATHVAWGAIRLEPTWMQTGEAAGFAVALAEKDGVSPGELDAEFLVKELVKNRFYLSFFNDLDVSEDSELSRAAQYFSTQGFFVNYNARLSDPMEIGVLAVWKRIVSDTILDPEAIPIMIKQAEGGVAFPGKTRGQALLELWRDL